MKNLIKFIFLFLLPIAVFGQTSKTGIVQIINNASTVTCKHIGDLYFQIGGTPNLYACYTASGNPSVLSGGGGSGNVTGPVSSVVNDVATYAGTTGQILLDGGGPLPATKANVSHQWLNSYTLGTGLFTATQPAISDLTATFSAPLNLSTNTLSIVGAPGAVLAGATPAFTATPLLGTDNSAAGTLQLANGSANAHTIWASGATTSNTIKGFTTVPVTLDLIDCVVTSTTCQLADSGVLVSSLVANPMTTLGDEIYGGVSGAFTRLAGPTTPNGVPQFLIDTPSSNAAIAETFSLAGIPVDASNPATLLATDRANYLNWTSGTTLALPAVATVFAYNLPFVIQNTSTTLTITPNAGASDLIDGASSGTLITNFAALVYQDNSTAPGHWFTIKYPTFAAFGSTCAVALKWSTSTGFACATLNGTGNLVGTTSPTLVTPTLGAALATSLVATGIVDGLMPINATTTTACTLGTATSNCGALSFSSGTTFNQEGTAATGVTYTLPATVQGKTYCVANSIVSGTGAADTGVLTVYPPASSYIIYKGTINTIGGGGTHGIASGGAAADSACFVANDATHWTVYVSSGTWTEN